MSHKFVILLDGELRTYDKFEDIPLEFDNVIEFLPEFKAGPHTDEEHEELDLWDDKLQELMRRERASSN